MPKAKAKRAGGPGATPKYPWRDMDIGDSFYYAPQCKSYHISGASYAAKMGVSLDREFETKKTKKGRIKVTRTA